MMKVVIMQFPSFKSPHNPGYFWGRKHS